MSLTVFWANPYKSEIQQKKKIREKRKSSHKNIIHFCFQQAFYIIYLLSKSYIYKRMTETNPPEDIAIEKLVMKILNFRYWRL